MNTSFTLSLSELDQNFLNTIKTIFKKEREIVISITSINDFELNKPETNENYIKRVLKAKKNLQAGKGLVFTETELNKLYSNTVQ